MMGYFIVLWKLVQTQSLKGRFESVRNTINTIKSIGNFHQDRRGSCHNSKGIVDKFVCQTSLLFDCYISQIFVVVEEKQNNCLHAIYLKLIIFSPKCTFDQTRAVFNVPSQTSLLEFFFVKVFEIHMCVSYLFGYSKIHFVCINRP